MRIKAIELLTILKENNWIVEDQTTENFQISAFNIYHLFYVFIDLKILKKSKYNYQLTQTIQNKNKEETIFSELHFQTNNIIDLVIKMGNQIEHLTKENFADQVKELSKLDTEIFANNSLGEIIKINFN